MRKLLTMLLIVFATTSAQAKWSGFQVNPPTTTSVVEHAPRPMGTPSNCDSILSSDAKAGHVIIGLTIDKNGHPQDLHIAQSSMVRDLDDLALSCASHWRYSPPLANGELTEIPITTEVTFHSLYWEMPQNQSPPLNVCSKIPPDVKVDPNVEKKTDVLFIVDTSGKVKDEIIEDSSGDPNFDSMAVQCASEWRYRPSTWNGSPYDAQWDAQVAWTPGIGLIRYEDAVTGVHSRCSDEWFPKGGVAKTPSADTVLYFDIVAGGYTSNITVHSSSGSSEFDQAAVDCAQTWRYVGKKYADPEFRQPWAVEIIWKNGHAYVVANGVTRS